MGKSKTYPAFFTPYMPKLTSQKLVIPIAFIVRIGKMVPDKTMLRNQHGRLWQVEVVKTDSSVFFLNGWEKFVKDNSVKVGEFLVFQYNGDCIFDVKIFGIHGCENEDARASTSIGKRICFSKEGEEEEEGKHCKKQKQKQKVIEGDEDEDEDDDDDGEDDNNSKEEDVDDEEDEDDEYYVEEEDFNDYDDDEEEEETKACGRGRRKKKGQNEKTQALKAKDRSDIEKYVDPKSPYFVTRLLAKRNTKLYVPSDVIQDFNIQFYQEMKITFCVPNGRDCRGEVTIWKDGRVWIKGWTKFCKWNLVTKDDKCICELVEGRGDLIKVHIVRSEQT